MGERIKTVVFAVGACCASYLLIYSAAYVTGWVTRYSLMAVAGVVALRLAWMVLRAGVRGRPVFEVPPEPDVTVPILGRGPVPARPAAGDSASEVPDFRGLQRTPAPAEAWLVADTQQV